MSLQLVVYPQSFEGQFTDVAVPFFTQQVSNYSFRNGSIGTVTTVTNANPVAEVVSSVAPINKWNTWHSTGGSWTSIDAPVITSNKITFDSATSDSTTGAYQLVSNLLVGSIYELKIEILAGTTGTLKIGHTGNWVFNNVLYKPILNTSITPSVSTQAFTFTATDEDMVVMLDYRNDDNSNLEIGSVSIKQTTSASATNEYTDGSVIVDLYEDETIPLTLSIDDFKNFSEKVQSYSKSFDLPATKRNNKIFSSLFEVTRSVKNDTYAFNPYRKTKSVLKEDGHTIFDGHLRLTQIKDKEGEVIYTVNLYGDTVTLADTLKNKKFKDIDFTELNHAYNKTVIKSSFEGDLTLSSPLPTGTFAGTAGDSTTDVLKYPFVKWNGNTYLDSSILIKMISLEDVFRPWIRCKYLLDRIISEAGFTYSSDFLNTSDFNRLFMDFNWGANTIAESTNELSDEAVFEATHIISSGTYTNLRASSFTSSGTTSTSLPWSFTNHKFTATQDTQLYTVNYNIKIRNNASGSGNTATLRWVRKNASGVIIETPAQHAPVSYATIVDNAIFSGNFNVVLDNNDTLEVQALGSSANIKQTNPSYATINVANTAITPEVLLSKRGELGQYDFLKGIFTMFNLVVMQGNQDPLHLIIEPYEAVFIDDSLSQYVTINEHDWTDKVDDSMMDLKPLPLKKKVIFNYKEEKNDYGLTIYKDATGYDYGSQEITATEFTVLDGEERITANPFSATLIKPIFEGFTPEMTIPVIYKQAGSGQFDGFDNTPRILYDVSHTTKITMSLKKYKIPAQNGLSSEEQSSFCQFAHTTNIPPQITSKDYNFGQVQLVGNYGKAPIDNLFNKYWLPYYDELYNPDNKTIKLKIYLTPAEIANFNFNDKVTIKNSIYRVNKIDYKPYELSTVELILLA